MRKRLGRVFEMDHAPMSGTRPRRRRMDQKWSHDHDSSCRDKAVDRVFFRASRPCTKAARIELAREMRARQHPHRAIARPAVIEMESQGDHPFQENRGRQSVRNARLELLSSLVNGTVFAPLFVTLRR
jgi:hypothetical protein